MQAETNVDFTARRSVLDCIRHEIQKQLPQSRRIAHDRDVRSELKVDCNAGAFAKYQRGFVYVVNERLERNRLTMNVEPSFICASERERLSTRSAIRVVS
jgi:hypothetical protein